MTQRPGASETLLYRPALVACATLHYAEARSDVDEWQRVALLAPLPDGASSPWSEAIEIGRALPDLDDAPEEGAAFAGLSTAAARKTSYTRWRKMLASHLYRSRPLPLWRSRKPKLVSLPGEDEAVFRGRLRDRLREERDLAVEKLRRRYAPKLATLENRIKRAEQRVEVEREQYQQQKTQTAISIGATVLGALFGRKLASAGGVGRATTAARGVGRATRERGDIDRAREKAEMVRERLADLERRFEEDLEGVRGDLSPDALEVQEKKLRPRKTDLEVEHLLLVWTPWRVGDGGAVEAAYDLG